MPVPTPVPTPPPDGGADCGQLKADRATIQRDIASWQARLAAAPAGDGPGSKGDIEETLALLSQELDSTQATIAENGCDEGPTPPGCRQEFTTPHGTYTLAGAFCVKWRSLTQAQRVSLGNPSSATMLPPDLVDVQQFDGGTMIDKQGLYGGPHVLYGPIYDAYMARGGYAGAVFGVPTSDVVDGPGGGQQGMFEAADLAYRQDLGTIEVAGAFRDLWDEVGGVDSILGYPTAGPTATSDGLGQSLQFTGGAIYWSPTTGAHELHGPILDLWNSLGAEASYLGYPTSDVDPWTTPETVQSGVASNFQGGQIVWTQEGGAVEIPGSAAWVASVRDIAILKGVTSEATLRSSWLTTSATRGSVQSLVAIVEAAGGTVRRLTSDGGVLAICGTTKALSKILGMKIESGTIDAVKDIATGVGGVAAGYGAVVAIEIAAATLAPEVAIPAYLIYSGYAAAAAAIAGGDVFIWAGINELQQAGSSVPVPVTTSGADTTVGAVPEGMDTTQVTVSPPVDPTQYPTDPGGPVDPGDFDF